MSPVPMAQENQQPYPAEILNLPSFHPHIASREEAEDFVKQHHKGFGSFIVRPNTRNDPSFVSITTSISEDGASCHAKVLIVQTYSGEYEYFISDKLKFETFKKLLEYYRLHRIHCQQNIDNIRLLTPLTSQHEAQPSEHVRNLGGILDSEGEEKRKSSGSSGSDDTLMARQNVSRTPTDNTVSQTLPRAGAGGMSAQQAQQARAGVKKTRAHSECSGHIIRSMPRQNSSPTGRNRGHSMVTSQSDANFRLVKSRQAQRCSSESKIQELDESNRAHGTSFHPSKYANAACFNEDPKMIMKCRPPAPLPTVQTTTEDDNFYYSHIDANKDFFNETYQFLKETELCECGLRIIDSELPFGWTIHRSQDGATQNQIFFQHGEDTTWEMPQNLRPHLTVKQLEFLLFLCHDGRQPVPRWLRKLLDERVMGKKRGSPHYESSSGGSSAQSHTSSRAVTFSVGSVDNVSATFSQNISTSSSGSPEAFGVVHSSGPYETPGSLLLAEGGSVDSGQFGQDKGGAVVMVSITPKSAKNCLRPVSFNSTPSINISSKAGTPQPSMPYNNSPQEEQQKILQQQLHTQQDGQIPMLQQQPGSVQVGSPQGASPQRMSVKQLAQIHQQQLQQQQQQQQPSQQQRQQVPRRGPNVLSMSQDSSFDKFLDSLKDTHL